MHPASSFSQEVDTSAFNHLLKTARWLTDYEAVCWSANETDQRFSQKPFIRLGQGGFCRPDNTGKWHIYYTEQNDAHILSHWIVTTDKVEKQEPAEADNSFTYVLKALQDVSFQLKDIADSMNIHLDQFVKIREDGSLDIFVFPSFQPSGQGIYGAEWRFHYSAEGVKLPEFNSFIKELKGVWIGQPRELWLDYTTVDAPTMGAVYFAWYYKDFFTRIHINCRLCKSTLEKDAAGYYHWSHKLKNE
jgi:hypothetical protein